MDRLTKKVVCSLCGEVFEAKHKSISRYCPACLKSMRIGAVRKWHNRQKREAVNRKLGEV